MNIDYKIYSDFFESDDTRNHVIEINGNIFDYNDQLKKVWLGKIRAYKVDWLGSLDTENANIILDVDQYDELCDISVELTNCFEELSERKWKKLGWDTPCCPCNFIIIDSVLINQKYRGYKAGLAAVHDLIKVFAIDCKFAALHVFPLQFHQEFDFIPRCEKLNYLPKDRKASIEKLKQHYQKLGFKSISTTNDMDIMVLNLEYCLPTLEKIGYKSLH